MKRILFGRIASFFLIGLIFFGSIGINVFAHFCHKDGTSISFFLPKEHQCKPIEKTPSCCHAEQTEQLQKNTDAAFDNSCCSEEVNVYKISSDFNLQKITKANVWIVQSFFEQAENDYTEFLATAFICPELQDPPPISGKQLLIQHQVFRI